eukprot:3634535-Prymnesium_polylepis.5
MGRDRARSATLRGGRLPCAADHAEWVRTQGDSHTIGCHVPRPACRPRQVPAGAAQGGGHRVAARGARRQRSQRRLCERAGACTPPPAHSLFASAPRMGCVCACACIQKLMVCLHSAAAALVLRSLVAGPVGAPDAQAGGACNRVWAALGVRDTPTRDRDAQECGREVRMPAA